MVRSHSDTTKHYRNMAKHVDLRKEEVSYEAGDEKRTGSEHTNQRARHIPEYSHIRKAPAHSKVRRRAKETKTKTTRSGVAPGGNKQRLNAQKSGSSAFVKRKRMDVGEAEHLRELQRHLLLQQSKAHFHRRNLDQIPIPIQIPI